MAYRILMIEDEPDIREVVGKYLEKESHLVRLAADGFQGLSSFKEFQPHLVLLDVTMPGISGFEVLKQLRQITDIPIILLTARTQEVDRLQGFDLGVDDYILKPFSPREVVKRVQVLLKRVYEGNLKVPRDNLIDNNSLQVGQLKLDMAAYKLYKNNEEIDITTKEFEILKVFFQHKGRLLTREQLIEQAFGDDYEGYDRNIDTYIKKIRQKIEEDAKNPMHLKTKYGAGYLFE